jgi:hypothetical protein
MFLLKLLRGALLFGEVVPKTDANWDWFNSMGETFLHLGRIRLIFTPGDYLARRRREKNDAEARASQGGRGVHRDAA